MVADGPVRYVLSQFRARQPALRHNRRMASPDPNLLMTRLRQALDRYRVRQGKALVAVSGGPDSIALLQALHEIAHANDQAETVLHNLLRGTGLRGQRGIAPARKLSTNTSLGHLVLLRPLLLTSRDEVLAFLASREITPRYDRSNDDPRFTRNRLRHD